MSGVTNLFTLSFIDPVYNGYYLDEFGNVWSTHGSRGATPRRIATWNFFTDKKFPYTANQIREIHACRLERWKSQLADMKRAMTDNPNTSDEYLIAIIDDDGVPKFGSTPVVYDNIKDVEKEIELLATCYPKNVYTYFKRMKTAKANGVVWN